MADLTARTAHINLNGREAQRLAARIIDVPAVHGCTIDGGRSAR